MQIREWSDLPPAIVAAEQAGAIGLAHMLRALNSGRIAFLSLLPDASAGKFKGFAAATRGRPACVLVGDDDYMNRGPAGWPQAERAVRWAASVVLHAAGAELHHYEAAIQAAQDVKRVLFIECSSRTAEAWYGLIRRAPHKPSSLLIWPRGDLHPINPARHLMQ